MSTMRARKLKKPSEPPSPPEGGSLSRSSTPPPPRDRATVMPVTVEHPKMNPAMWAALKKHIMRQREKQKQEQEADAATERGRSERESKRPQDEMTLEQVRDELQQSEKKLATLKEEKHKLFVQLKKVLQEDDARKRGLEKKADKMAALDRHYHQQQPQNIQERNGAHSTYELPQPIPQNPGVMHRAPLKMRLNPYPPPPWLQAATSSSSQQATPPQPGFWPQQPYAYTAQLPGSTAYGAPLLMPAYAPGYGPFYSAGTEGRGGVNR
ncbi:G protein pathway suppressor 2-like [Dermacentor albipictus]|uniref:G protein pathway suppressor 2-like n=1 Tax=Dermacentor albipictus TaxID=60249 RepID=UPI0031FDFCD8